MLKTTDYTDFTDTNSSFVIYPCSLLAARHSPSIEHFNQAQPLRGGGDDFERAFF
jgi:hypothetical protein